MSFFKSVAFRELLNLSFFSRKIATDQLTADSYFLILKSKLCVKPYKKRIGLMKIGKDP